MKTVFCLILGTWIGTQVAEREPVKRPIDVEFLPAVVETGRADRPWRLRGSRLLEEVRLSESLIAALETRKRGETVNTKRLKSFAAAAVSAGDRHGVPPSLLLATAWNESGFGPSKVGKAGELSAWQIMSRYRNKKYSEFGRSRYATDAAYRERCHKKAHACQAIPAMLAAKRLRKGLKKCGTWEGAARRYQSGQCKRKGRATRYAKNVMALKRQIEAGGRS